MILWHYTCDHSVPGIRKAGKLIPNSRAASAGLPVLVWLTDLDAPHQAALGLWAQLAKCDRMAWRVTVSTGQAVRWGRFMRGKPPAWRVLEAADGAMPAHWYVAEVPIPILRIERRRVLLERTARASGNGK